MKLIINISNELYKLVDKIKNGSIGAEQIINCVRNGIPAYKEYKGTISVTEFADKCRECGQLHRIPIPDNATNGDVIKAIFRNRVSKGIDIVAILDLDGFIISKFTMAWWNAPYKGE